MVIFGELSLFSDVIICFCNFVEFDFRCFRIVLILFSNVFGVDLESVLIVVIF